MASSSSPAIIPTEKHYDVFLSFRGEDTRNGFTSHLYEALCNNQILTFIDNNLQRGGDISPSLLTVIQESAISVIIFSENYADSRWCLKELAEIIQNKHNGQIVIPVFYGVDPSHVKKQIGMFGAAFDKLKERLSDGEMDLNEVRSHLEEAATISGWNSQDIRPESKLIKSIVGDILNKFNRMTNKLNLSSNLIGIGSHVKRVETLLCLESLRFRMVGLWGMGGIGKTTIARATFNHICSRFDAFYFVESVSNELRNQSVDDLRKKMVLKLLEKESINMDNRTLHHDFIIKHFQRKKVLIVLDDVEDATKANDLLSGQYDHFFSGGSRILVTSRNRQVLKVVVGDENLIYEVEGLNEEEGLQLFSLSAFKQNHPTSVHFELSRRVLRYTRGNPLALVVLGHALFDKSVEEWESALGMLRGTLFPRIQEVLRVSYNALCDEEKKIFLDIACFLVGKTMDFVVAFYEGRVEGTKFMISNLVDKSLITISRNKELGMHDLLKEMGRCIESAKGPERTRIWNLKDVPKKRKVRSHGLFLQISRIFNCFSKKRKVCSHDHQRNSMVEAISIDLSQAEEISEFDCSVLSRLDRLKFLEFHGTMESKVRFRWEGFKGLSDEVRYLRWDSYPLKSLPSKFCVENLVELRMPFSNITKLWTGKQNIVNLKVVNLEYSSKLVEFPDVSECKNIEEIHLWWCESLVKVSPSIHHLPKLKTLELWPGPIFENVSATFASKVLETLYLRRGFKTFPHLPSANAIRILRLCGTDIREVPSSVELLKRLEFLYMRGCEKLSIISTNICKMKSLSQLYLENCTNLESFPMEPMKSLTHLWLRGCTRLRKLPNSFHNLKSLSKLDLDDCTNLESFPEIMEPMESLWHLSLNRCTRLKRLPNSFHNLKSLINLLLNRTAITELPSSIQYLIHISELEISGCGKLTCLPSFIYNMRGLSTINANGCVSLKSISSSSACFPFESEVRYLRFSNCINLDGDESRRLLDAVFSNLNQRTLYHTQQFRILLPWSTEFPQWFGGSQNVGSSLTLKLPIEYEEEIGLAFCVVIKPKYSNFSDSTYFNNRMNCYYVDYDGCEVEVTTEGHIDGGLSNDTEHLLLWNHPWRCHEYLGREVSFQFRDCEGEVEVTRCGLRIVPLQKGTRDDFSVFHRLFLQSWDLNLDTCPLISKRHTDGSITKRHTG